MKKMWLFIKLNVFYVVRNRMRLVLTVFGISLGLLIFIIGNAVIHGYIQNLYNDVQNFPRNSYITCGLNDKNKEQIDKTFTGHVVNNYYGPSDAVLTKHNHVYNGVRINNSINFYGITQIDLKNGIPCIRYGRDNLCGSRLLYGRMIQAKDVSERSFVAVIERSSSVALFGCVDSVGKTIEVKGYYGYMSFQVIGVIEDVYSTRLRNIEHNQQLKTVQDVTIDNYVYIPFSTYDRIVNSENEMRQIYTVTDDQKDIASSFFKTLSDEDSVLRRGAYIISYDSGMHSAKEMENELQGVLHVCMLVVVLITAFTIAAIFVFSTKERFYEIGVRRAIGASRTDISAQFLLEGMVYSVIAWIFSYVLAVVICNLMQGIFMNYLYMDFRFAISGKTVMASLGIAMLEGIICSCIPAMLAARVRPTEVIRLD